ncbi:MAG: type II toxin-antitoxin system VapC family toxin [Deltaproteobacteria bacterium]|nr:type II toxin-antitoxin system VapC family toxin [Deltaproteobacteria bacterium]
MNLLLDTDVLIYFLRGDPRIKSLLLLNHSFYYSYITKKELLKKPGLSTAEAEAIMRLLNRLRQVSIDGRIASLAGELLKKHRHRGLKIPDALIAASSIAKNLTLVTFNRKHFRFIPGLLLFSMETLGGTG